MPPFDGSITKGNSVKYNGLHLNSELLIPLLGQLIKKVINNISKWSGGIINGVYQIFSIILLN